MAYSTIERKKCKCGCGRWPTLSCFGKNYQCLTPKEREKAGTKQKVAKKNKASRQAQARKLHIAQKAVDGGLAERLSLWFKYQMNVSKKECENCGTSLEHYNEHDWYGSQHHLVDKALCPSVASDPRNHGVLGKWCCHSQWHTSFLNASKMPFFGVAKERFQSFKDDIASNEFKKVNPYLL